MERGADDFEIDETVGWYRQLMNEWMQTSLRELRANLERGLEMLQ